MAIIIEGISKGPIKGYDAQLLLHDDGIVMEKFNGVYQTLGAEWKELPDKHGRLIDADRLAEAFKVFATGSEIGYLRLINEAPTVLEAN